jgi:ketosteroid isomerase-like protein
MATEPVIETIRCAYRRDWLAMHHRDVESALIEVLDPNVVFTPERVPGTRPVSYIGIAEILRLLNGARGDWDSCRYILDEVSELSAGHVLVSGRVVADVARSKARTSYCFTHVWSAQRGRITSVEAYQDRDEAVRAIGECCGNSGR